MLLADDLVIGVQGHAGIRELPHGVAVIGVEAGPLSQWLYRG